MTRERCTICHAIAPAPGAAYTAPNGWQSIPGKLDTLGWIEAQVRCPLHRYDEAAS